MTIFDDADLKDSYLLPQEIDYLKQWSRFRKNSLYLRGCYGSGKTWTVHAIMREIRKHIGPPYFYHFFFESPEIESRLREALLNGGENHLIEKWSEAPLLIIDDLGREKASERVQQQYYRIVNNRYKHNLPTIVTSNYKPSELGLDGATISRIQSWRDISFPSMDRRVRKTGFQNKDLKAIGGV